MQTVISCCYFWLPDTDMQSYRQFAGEAVTLQVRVLSERVTLIPSAATTLKIKSFKFHVQRTLHRLAAYLIAMEAVTFGI